MLLATGAPSMALGDRLQIRKKLPEESAMVGVLWLNVTIFGFTVSA
jgi:hypothetical protein